MTTFSYSVTEYDPDRPWIIVSQRTGLTVDLEDANQFFDWSGERWPRPRYAAQLDPQPGRPRP